MLKGEVERACTKGSVSEWEEERVLGRNETPEHLIRGPSVVDHLGGERERDCILPLQKDASVVSICVPLVTDS